MNAYEASKMLRNISGMDSTTKKVTDILIEQSRQMREYAAKGSLGLIPQHDYVQQALLSGGGQFDSMAQRAQQPLVEAELNQKRLREAQRLSNRIENDLHRRIRNDAFSAREKINCFGITARETALKQLHEQNNSLGDIIESRRVAAKQEFDRIDTMVRLAKVKAIELNRAHESTIERARRQALENGTIIPDAAKIVAENLRRIEEDQKRLMSTSIRRNIDLELKRDYQGRNNSARQFMKDTLRSIECETERAHRIEMSFRPQYEVREWHYEDFSPTRVETPMRKINLAKIKLDDFDVERKTRLEDLLPNKQLKIFILVGSREIRFEKLTALDESTIMVEGYDQNDKFVVVKIKAEDFTCIFEVSELPSFKNLIIH